MTELFQQCILLKHAVVSGPCGLVNVQNMWNFNFVANNGRQLRVNNFVEYWKTCEGLRCKHWGEVRMHAFGNAEIVSKDIIDFFKCNKVISTMSGLLAVMVLLVWMGMSHTMVTLSFSMTVLGSCSFRRSFTSKPNYLQIFQYICAAALLRRWIARDQMVNGLIETAT